MARAISPFPDTADAAFQDGVIHDGRRAVYEELSREPGFVVFRNLTPADVVEGAVRLLNLEIVRSGLSADEIAFAGHLLSTPAMGAGGTGATRATSADAHAA